MRPAVATAPALRDLPPLNRGVRRCARRNAVPLSDYWVALSALEGANSGWLRGSLRRLGKEEPAASDGAAFAEAAECVGRGTGWYGISSARRWMSSVSRPTNPSLFARARVAAH